MEGIIIRHISTADADYQQVWQLREEILRKPIGLSLANEDLSGEEKETILAAFLERELTGCLMLQHKDKETVKYRQMAVAEDQQGRNIGRKLMEAAERLSKEKGYKKVVLHARETAAGFYEKLGYRICSGLFTEVGIPHYLMEKEL